MNKKHRIVSKNKRMRSKSRNKTNRRVRRKSMQSRKTLNNRRRKTYKRKTKKNYRMVGGAYTYKQDDFRGIKVKGFKELMQWFESNKGTLEKRMNMIILEYNTRYSFMTYIPDSDGGNPSFYVTNVDMQGDNEFTLNKTITIDITNGLNNQTLDSFKTEDTLSELNEGDEIIIYYVKGFDMDSLNDFEKNNIELTEILKGIKDNAPVVVVEPPVEDTGDSGTGDSGNTGDSGKSNMPVELNEALNEAMKIKGIDEALSNIYKGLGIEARDKLNDIAKALESCKGSEE